MKKIMIVISLTLVLILGIAGLSAGEGKIGLSIGSFYNLALQEKEGNNASKNYFSLAGGFRSKFDGFILNTDIDYQSENQDIDIIYILTSKISLLKEILKSGFYLGAGIEKSYVKWISGATETSEFSYFIQAGWEIPCENLSLALDICYEPSPPFQQDIDTDFISLGIRLLFYI